jgi:hypothetical protein
LVVNTRFIEFFNYSFTQTDLKEATCGCLEEIVNKGMEPMAKLKLVDYLWTNVIYQFANNLINVSFKIVRVPLNINYFFKGRRLRLFA